MSIDFYAKHEEFDYSKWDRSKRDWYLKKLEKRNTKLEE